MSRPKKAKSLRWRIDGEADQLVILHRDEFALPRILNPTAAEIFLQCDGEKTVEEIIGKVHDKFDIESFDTVSREVKECINTFIEKRIVEL